MNLFVSSVVQVSMIKIELWRNACVDDWVIVEFIELDTEFYHIAA